MIVFPFPPSIDSAYGQRAGHQRYYTKKAKEWIKSCPKLFASAIDYEVIIEYKIYYPDKRIRDNSNYIKLIEDYLVKSGVLADDNYTVVKKFSVETMGVDKQNPRVEVYIEPVLPFNI